MRGPPQIFQSSESINGVRQISKNSSIPSQHQLLNVLINLIFLLDRPTVAPPPRPPPTKPPPPPLRSVSNTNLTNLPLTLPASTNINNNQENQNFGSIKNVQAFKEQLKSQMTGSVNNVSNLNTSNSSNSSSNSISVGNLTTVGKTNGNAPAPPLPPHRTCPAPPPIMRQASNVCFGFLDYLIKAD